MGILYIRIYTYMYIVYTYMYGVLGSSWGRSETAGMCIYVHMYVHECIHICICIYICMCINLCEYTSVCIYIECVIGISSGRSEAAGADDEYRNIFRYMFVST